MDEGTGNRCSSATQLRAWPAKPGDPIEALAPPSLLSSVLAAFAEAMEVWSVQDLAEVDIRAARLLRGVGAAKMGALEELQQRARAVCEDPCPVDLTTEVESPWPASPDDPIAVLAPPTLLSAALGAIGRSMGVRSVADLAIMDLEAARRVRGVGRLKMEALAELKERARTACPPEAQVQAAAEGAVSDSLRPLGKLIVAAETVFGATTLADLADVPWAKLIALGVEADEATIELRELAPRSFRLLSASASIERALDELDDRSREILIRNELTERSSRATLEALGGEFGLTRERIRQIKLRALRQFDDITSSVLGQVRPWLLHLAGEVCRIARFDERWAAVLEPTTAELRPVVRSALVRAAGYVQRTDGWALTESASRALDGVRDRLREAGRERGVVPASAINEALGHYVLVGEEREAFLEEVVRLTRFEGGWIPSDSLRARVVAALSIIGVPATKSEIGEMAGATPARVGSYLSGVPGVCRADKERWAFEEWVDDPYDGIVGEILQRIDEDGGLTTVQRLLTELPATFGVSELSVRSYLATPRFVVRNGTVRLATESEVATTYYGSVEDVSSAVRLENGAWGVRIHVEERFFNGYSAGFPLPVAQAMGIQPGESLVVPVADTPHSVSLIWRIDNTNRLVDLGRLAPVLEHLGVSAGEDLVVAPGRTEVRIYRGDDAPVAGVNRHSTPDVVVDAILDDLFSR